MGIFDEIAARVDAESPDPLNQLAFTGVQQNPDELAGAMALGKRMGVPTEFALDPKLRPGFEQDDKLATTQQKLQNLGPRAQGWVSKDRHNIGLVYDELDTLGSIESAFNRAKRVNADRVRAENYRTGTGVAEGFGRGLLTGVANLAKAGTDVRHAAIQATVGRLFGGKVGSAVNKAVDPIMLDYALGQGGQGLSDLLTPGNRQTISTFITDPKTGKEFINPGAINPLTGSGLENLSQIVAQEAAPMAAMVGLTALTEGATTPLLAAKYGQNLAKLGKLGRYAATLLKHSTTTVAAIEGARTISGQYENGIQQVMAERHLSREDAEVVVAPGALLAGMLSTPAGGLESRFMGDLWGKVAKAPGGKTLLAKIAQKGAAMVKKGGEEALQETVQGGGEDLAEWITYNPDKTIKEVAANMLMNAAGGFILGGPTGMFHGSRPADTQQLLTELSGIAKSSKLNQRASDKFQEAVQEMAGDQENLLIPADRYFQTVTDAGLDPAELAQSLGVVNLQEAMEAGTDVVIPVGAYAAQIAATDLHGKLAQDIRLNPGDSTMREEQEAGKLAEDEAAKTTEDAQSIQVQAEIDALSTSSELDKYRESVKQAMIGGNIPADQAADLAETWIQPARVFIEQGDITAEQAAQMWPLTVTAYRKGEGKKSIAQIALDRLKAMGTGIKEYAQSVFHGSPYRFDKFSLEHMGKGEGAQAYGWGLYFAGSKEVGEYYRKTLSDGSNQRSYEYKGETFQPGTPEWKAVGTIQNDGKRAAVKLFKEMLSDAKNGADYTKENGVEFYQKMLDIAESHTPKDKIKELSGQLYQVDIPDDGAYLLWDKPLSEQPEAVKANLESEELVDFAANKGLSSHGEFKDLGWTKTVGSMSGEELYKRLVEREMGNTIDRRGAEEKASKVLHAAGISGIKYEDGSSRGKDGEKSHNYVVFDDNAVKVMKTFYQRGGGRYASNAEKRSARARRAGQNTQASMDKAKTDLHNADETEFAAFNAAVDEVQAGDILDDRRGFIQFGNQQIQIGLLEGRNLSTILHETSHAFLEMLADVAEMPTASERTKTLWADTLKELGIESRAQIKTKQHEQFASWGERYFMEGKAPSEKMRPLMQRFQSWMQMVYKTLEKMGVRMNDDVRSVFDRLLATDAEIEAHKPTFETFATAEAMHSSQAEFEIYKKACSGAIQEGHDRLQVEVMGDLLREQKAAYKAEKVAARAEVEAGVDSRPDMKAIAALTDPTNEIKLNRQAVQDQFGDARGLPVVEEGGMDAEAAAEMLGFDSGAQLYQALKDAPARADLIDTLTDEIMFSRYGDVTLDGSIADKAVEALHNDKQADVLAMELRAMSRLKRIAEKVGKAKEGQDKAAQKAADVQIPGVSAFREQARNMVSGMTLRQMEPHKYELAELKYRKEADKLTKKKDYEGAVKAKTREMLNHFLYREAKKGQEEGDKYQAKAKRGIKAAFQAMLGKAGKGFQDAYNKILKDIEFADVSGIKLDERNASLVALQMAHESAGIDIDPAVLAMFPKNYREIPMSELRAVNDALENIEHVARETGKVINGKAKEDIDDVVAGLVARALASNTVKPLGRAGSTVNFKEEKHRSLKGLDAYTHQMITIIDDLDAGDANGEWHKAIWQPISDAMGAESELGAAILKRVYEITESHGIFTKKYLDTSIGITLPGETVPLNKREAIGFLFNLCSKENRNALLGGYKLIQADGSLNPMVDSIISTLTKDEVLFVQDVVNVLESLWPAVEEQERQLKGIVPTKKTATPILVKTRDGEEVLVDGGYFPLVGEPLDRTGKRQLSGDLSQLFEEGYTPATTSRSHTEEVTGATYRVSLDFGATLSRHLPSVIKDITHRQAVLSINRLLNRAEVSKVIQETLGPEYEAEFMPWLKATVNNRNAGPQEGGPLLRWMLKHKHGAAIATLGYNLASSAIQSTDFGKVWLEVPAWNLAKAAATIARNPVDTIAMIRDLSPNRMRNFEAHYHRELMQFFESKDIFEKSKGKVTENSMIGFKIMGELTAFPAWLGTYQKAMAAHGDQGKAVIEADVVVDRVIQMGSPANLSRMMREKGAMQLLTMFQGDLNIWLNRISYAVGRKQYGKVGKALLTYYLMGVLGNILVGRGPKDDEDWLEWLAIKALIGVPELVPMVGDIGKATVAGATGTAPWNMQYNNPVFNALMKPAKALSEIHEQIQDGDNGADVAFGVVDAVGTWRGYSGTYQILKTSKYLNRLYKGEEQPDNAGDIAMGVLFNKRNSTK